MNNIERSIFKIVEKGSHGSNIYRVFDFSIMILILLNVVAIILGLITELSDPVHKVYKAFEIFSIAIFSLEYLFRLYVAHITHPAKNRIRSILKYATSFYGIIDLLAILPFYFIKSDLRYVKLLRSLRIFRLLKLGHYSRSLQIIRQVIRDKKTELSLTLILVAILLILASIAMYNIESDKFPNILDAFAWSIATLTELGYGEVYPSKPLGKVISSLIAFMGIGLVALPTGIISAGFISRIEKEKEKEKEKRWRMRARSFKREPNQTVAQGLWADMI